MCGIAGLVDYKGHVDDLENTLKEITDCLSYRGPDASGYWKDDQLRLGLGHRRLSILDLSELGKQPMISSSGRFVIDFNGEVYNFQDLKDKLLSKGHSFRGQSDTEVLLAAFEEWGVSSSLSMLNGMFAIAIHDRESKKLFLVRDRLGIKPLYYGWVNQIFVFGSELKSFRSLPDFNNPINRSALREYMWHGYIPHPHCIYEGIQSLIPGSFLEIDLAAGRLPQVSAPQKYWSLEDSIQDQEYIGSFEKASNDLEALLLDSVGKRMISDVSLGAFLSGGIDSSLVVALMQHQSSNAVKTFSIGFEEKKYDEAVFAKDVSSHLGTDHTELYVSGQDAMDVIPMLSEMYDEPFADSSQIPTYLVSKLAREEVTVSLSGDGGDELFAGYTEAYGMRHLWNKLDKLPSSLRSITGSVIQGVPDGVYSALDGPISKLLSNYGHEGSSGPEKLSKVSEILKIPSFEAYFKRVRSHWVNDDIVLGNSSRSSTIFESERAKNISTDYLERMMFMDLHSYLPDDILVKLDRASMAVSLESRVPLLDHRIVEFAWKLPLNFRPSEPQSKELLRSVLYRHVPKELIERPKKGFGIPVGEWLRGPLRDWTESLIDPRVLESQGFLNPKLIHSKWREHLEGKKDWGHYMWDVLMFQAWHERWC